MMTLPRRLKRLRPWLDLCSTVLMMGATVVLIWSYWPTRNRTQEPVLPAEPVEITGATVLGVQSAPLAIIIYSEFQCPYCASFAASSWPKLQKLIDSGKMVLVFRHFPLERIHPAAFSAAIAAECANGQGQFAAYHDKLFTNQKTLGSELYRGLALEMGLDMSRFDECLGQGSERRVRADIESGKRLGVDSTPTFFVGKVLPGAKVRVTESMKGAVAAERLFDALERAEVSGGEKLFGGSAVGWWVSGLALGLVTLIVMRRRLRGI